MLAKRKFTGCHGAGRDHRGGPTVFFYPVFLDNLTVGPIPPHLLVNEEAPAQTFLPRGHNFVQRQGYGLRIRLLSAVVWPLKPWLQWCTVATGKDFAIVVTEDFPNGRQQAVHILFMIVYAKTDTHHAVGSRAQRRPLRLTCQTLHVRMVAKRGMADSDSPFKTI